VKFQPTLIDGVCRVVLEAREDERGYFARSFCEEEFRLHGLPGVFEQSNLSYNIKRGTLRGLHFQPDPYGEAKFVRCVRGAIFDVAVDLRDGSPTRGQWTSATLSADNGLGFYIAPGIAHGFQTLGDDTTVLYQMTPPYQPGHGAGVRWNDPAFGIAWPIAAAILSDRDAGYPDWRP
jgi:dTDP-4-dehydrorhamnose 3,5-epimerase